MNEANLEGESGDWWTQGMVDGNRIECLSEVKENIYHRQRDEIREGMSRVEECM